MNLLLAEQDLETKLKADISNIRIEAYPDSPENYKCMSPNGAILIQYLGSVYGDMELEAVRGKVVSQERLLEWRFTILYRNLKSHTTTQSGIYTYIESLRTSLTGYTIDSLDEAGVMYPAKDGFVNRHAQKMLWEYEFLFRHTYPETGAWQ